MTWLLAVSLAAAMSVTAVWTTYFWLRSARLPAFIAGVFAPAVTVAIVVAMGYLYNWFGIFWAGSTVLPVLAGIGLVGAAVFWKMRRTSALRGTGENTARHTPAWGSLFWLLVTVGWLLAVLPLMLSGPATNPVQQWDPSFHMNGVWSINNIGDGRMGSGLDALFREGNANEYPLGWHIFTSLFTTPSTVVLGSNASSLALILLWVVGAGAYTRMLFGMRAASLAAPVIAGCMLSMPGDALMAYNQWPNAAAVALLPGIAVVMILLGRHIADSFGGLVKPSWGKLVGGSTGLILSLIGAIVVHPSVAFNLLVLLLPAVIAGLSKLFHHHWRSGVRRRSAGIVVIFVAGIGIIYAVMETPTVRAMGNYPRSGISWSVAFANLLTPTPPYPNSVSLFLWSAVLAGLLLLGILATYLRRTWWMRVPSWPVWSFALFALLVFVSYSPNSALRTWLVAPWYSDPRRIMEPQSLALVPLVALGFAWLSAWLYGWVSQRSPRVSPRLLAAALGGALLIASGGGGLAARTEAARTVYDPLKLGKPGMATAGELTMLQGLDEVLPQDALILGDPQNGSVYVQAIGQRNVFFPALTLSGNPSVNEEVLVDSFNQIHFNPQVCKAVKEEGITHFYEDDDGYYYSRLRSERTPGLYNVDTSVGFELVAQGDTARLYRIAACD